MKHRIKVQVPVEKRGLLGFKKTVMETRTVEVDGRSGGYARSVGVTRELEVVVLIQVVARYRFAEAQHQVVTYAQDGVRGLRCAEQYRRTCILHTADYGRGLAHEARTVAAETYGTQVVLS